MSNENLLRGQVTWSFPTDVRFGVGSVEELGDCCRAAGIERPLIVTDEGVARLPILGRIGQILEEAGYEQQVFSDVRSNPTSAGVDAGVKAFRDGEHDGVIALGGGSGLDTGKLVAFMQAQHQSIWDFEDIGDHWKRARRKAIAPIIAVPTTAGTGSEVGRAGVVTNEAEHVKKVIFHPDMLPRTALLDPEVTVELPPFLTAATGMDAFAHCLEAYCAPSLHPMAEGIAVEGMRLVKNGLVNAFRRGEDLAARGQMMIAAAMGAVAFQKGLGAVHALSHPIGALYDTHHGLTNAVVMPYVLQFNRPAIDAKMDRLAGWLDLPGDGLDAVMDYVLELRETLSIPDTLEELGVPSDRINDLAAMAIVDPTAAGNPIPLDADVAVRIYEDAFTGTKQGKR